MMNDTLIRGFERAGAALSVVLMLACGVQLAVRFGRVLGVQEAADGHRRQAGAPLSALAAAAGVGLASRLALYLLAYALYRLLDVGTDTLWASLEPLWLHWDAAHYVGIAEEGYTCVGDARLRLVFFPLYPLLMRLLSPLTGFNVFAAGLCVSLLCSAAASALVYDLAFMHADGRIAWRSTAYFLLSPLSVFLCCAYTEALFICLTLMTVCLYRRGHPWLAAVCGMLSAFTRMPGVIVSGVMIIGYLERMAQRRADLRALLSCCAQVMIVFCGLFAYFAVNAWVTGDPFAYTVYQAENWFQRPGSFWHSTANTIYYFLITPGESDWLWTWGFQLVCMLGIYLLLAFGSRHLPFDLAAYSFVYVAVVLAPTWLLSGARYLYALCTLPLLLARMGVDRRIHALLLSASAAMLVLWTYGYTIAVQVL